MARPGGSWAAARGNSGKDDPDPEQENSKIAEASMSIVWLLMFTNVNNHVDSAVAIFATKAACLTTAKIEQRAANPKKDEGLHFYCQDFGISTEVGLECEPFISNNCLMKQAMKDVWSPDLGHK